MTADENKTGTKIIGGAPVVPKEVTIIGGSRSTEKPEIKTTKGTV